MTQEEKIVDNSIENDELHENDSDENLPQEEKSNDEKIKKVLLIVLIFVMFGGTYYYYGKMSKNKVKHNKQIMAINTTPSQKPEKVSKVENKPLIDLKEIKENIPVKNEAKVNVAEVKAQKTEIKQEPIVADSNPKIIRTSSKESLLKLAMASKGKSDPFEGSIKPINPQQPSIGSVPFKTGSLPPFIKGLPSLNGLPSLPSLGDFKNFNTLKNNDSIEIKGFIGNKVIVSVNGITESLKPNESFQDIKVISVDNKSLSAKFKKNNVIITKNIRSLTDIDNKNDIQLVKYIKK